MHPVWFAVGIGVLAAIALPLGAAIGLATRPGARMLSALMAFGAGTLLFALSVEIVAEQFEHSGFIALAIGAVLGGVLFEVFNQALNQQGAFLRKASIAVRHIARRRHAREAALLSRLSHVHLLQSLPPEDILPLVRAAKVLDMEPGQLLFSEGDTGSSLYLIDSGELEVIRGGVRVAILTPGETVGEMAVVTGVRRTATIRALERARLFYIPKPAFDQLVQNAARVRDRVAELIKLRTEELKERLLVAHAEADEWQSKAEQALQTEHIKITAEEIQSAAHEQRRPVLGVWLGNLLDNIPESLVLGATVTGAGALSWPLLAGIFLANFPEAMSSAGVMRLAGMSKRRILLMWASIIIPGGVCAALGNVFLTGVSARAFGVINGAAAGAMLVMIAETMLPEAYERGGAIVGLATLAGFLAALGVKSLA